MHTYTLSLEDVLTFCQYNESLKKKTAVQKYRLMFSAYFLLIGGICIYLSNYETATVFICIGLLYPFIGAMYMKRAYTNAFKKAILIDRKGQINAPNTFSVADNKIVIQDKGGIFYYNLSAIESVNEISSHFFIWFNNSHVLVVPKTEFDIGKIIKTLITEHNLPHVVQLDWKY